MSETNFREIQTRIKNKYDTLDNFDKATFVPLKGEIVFYDVDGNLNNRRMKIGDGQTSIQNLPFADILKPEYITYLDNQLYQAPSISSFEIVSGSKEVGQTYTISSFTHREANINNIDGTLTLKKDSSVVKDNISASTSNATISYSDTITRTSAGNITFTLSGVNTKGAAFSKQDTISFYFPSFIGGVSADTLSDVSSLTKIASASLSGTREVELSSVGYVYFITTTTISKITSGGFDVPTTNSTLTLNINGVNKEYKVYRTNELNPGKLTYVIS